MGEVDSTAFAGAKIAVMVEQGFISLRSEIIPLDDAKIAVRGAISH
jgi:hypothetical protein